MRTIILSDIHGNFTALEAVLEVAAPFDRVWCLGDIVGYGPDPNACIDRIRDLPQLACVKGNHDAASTGEIDLYAFNYEARTSLEWQTVKISAKNKDWLAGLPGRIDLDNVTLVHGSPRKPIWEYVMDLYTARVNMDAFSTQICLVGHTHIPCIFEQDADHLQSMQLIMMEEGEPFVVERKCIVNPGSVGQPRDHDPRASYMLYDDETGQWNYHRVEYDIPQVQQRIRSAGLPYRHASRLKDGW